jgi:hypothetical protein
MSIPRPRSLWRWLFAQPTSYAFVVAAFVSVVSITSAVDFWSQNRPRMAAVNVIAVAMILAATFVQHGLTLAAARKKDSTHELEGCLYTLHAVLLPPGSACTLRLAVHVPVPKTDFFEQVTEYIGDKPKPGRIGRRFPINAGIIGRAYNEKDAFVGRRANDDYQGYVQELVKDWNYTEDRAKLLNPGVREWMGVPIYDAGRDTVEAVLFLDATERDFFTEDRQETVLAAVSGIAVFIGKRYA